MNVPPPVNRFHLVIIDGDAAFRQRLRLSLQRCNDLDLVMEDPDGSAALQILETARGFATAKAELPAAEAIALVILDMTLGQSHPSQVQGLSLCQRIKGQYPDLPVLLLSATPDAAYLKAAYQAGADGYCAKSLGAESLVAIIRRVIGGKNYWMPLSPAQPRQAATPVAPRATAPHPWQGLKQRMRASGIEQIDTVMAALANELENFDLSLLDRAVTAGRYRELRAARWLVMRLLSTPDLERLTGATSGVRTPESKNPEGVINRPMNRSINPQINPPINPQIRSLPAPPQQTEAVTLQSPSFIEQVRDLRSLLFDNLSEKLQTSLENHTETPLEIDILREDKKRELFYLILRKIEDLLSELTYSQVQAVQLKQKQPAILQDLWQAIVTDFLGKYYTIPLLDRDVEVVEVLLQDVDMIQTTILDKIPGVSELLKHLIFQAPLEVDGTLYPPGNPEALARATALLENWMIQMANAVMQPLLNHFANVEQIKQIFYDRHLLSIREVERFRNDLSWHYRIGKLVQEPTDIFESKHQIWVLSGRGIRRVPIYAMRYPELATLDGIPRAITLVLEARDAIAPRLRSAVSFLGNGLIYVLTEVLGRGIGLVGRGVLKGMGNAWQDKRLSRK